MSNEPNDTAQPATPTNLVGAVLAAFTQLAAVAGDLQYRLGMYSSLMADELPDEADRVLTSMSAGFRAIQNDLQTTCSQLEGRQRLFHDEVKALRSLWLPCWQMASCQTSLIALMRGEFPAVLESYFQGILGNIVPSQLVVPTTPFAEDSTNDAVFEDATKDTTLLDTTARFTPAIVELKDKFFRMATWFEEFMVMRG